MADVDYKKLTDDEDSRLGELITRWKTDSDMYYLKPFVMMGPDGKNKVPDVINVTLSIPGRFANDVISMLGTAREQSIVESDDKNLDTTEIEAFRKAAFASANAQLRLQDRWELNPWWDFHSCIRGSCAALCTFQMDKDKDGKQVLVPNIDPWDRGMVRYGVGVNGMEWASYKTSRTPADIKAETWYEEAVSRFGLVLEAKDMLVLNVWDTEHNEVWVGDKQVFEQPHDWGFCPVVIQTVVLGSMLQDKDSISHRGESVFFLIREAMPELNRLLSIMQTLNLIILKPPKGWASVQGQDFKGLPNDAYTEIMKPGSITPQDIGGGVIDIKFGDAQRSAQLAYSIMREAIKEATVAASDLGVIESPPASGVRAMVAGESRDQLLSPRLGLKAMMNQGLADMFTQQVIQIGGSVELGTPGHKRKFQTSKLGGQYDGYYKYTIKSAAVDAGRASLAAAIGDSLPKRAKLVEILQREDPDGDERQLRWEEIERIVPPIKIHRDIRALLEMAEKGDENAELEAQIASEYMGLSLQQMLAGGMTPPQPEKTDEPTQVLSLFGPTASGTGKSKQPEPQPGEKG